MQFQIGGGQDNITGLVRIFPVDEHHHAQLALERDVPDRGGVEMDMGMLLQRPKVFEAMEILKVDLALILALRAAALGVGAGIKEATIRIGTQLRDRVQLKGHDFVNIFLFRKVAIHAVLIDPLGQARAAGRAVAACRNQYGSPPLPAGASACPRRAASETPRA